MLELDATTWRTARRALEKAFALYLHDPNVSHIDLGRRIRSSAGNRLEPELVVRVHVRRKLYGREFEVFAARQPERVIVAKRIGFAVDVPQANYHLERGRESTGDENERRGLQPKRHDGIRGSLAAGHGFGALAGKVRDRHTGEDMLLSTWHVLAGSWAVGPGCPIHQTIPGDRRRNGKNIIATLARHAMEVNLDAALARLEEKQPLLNGQLGVGAVTGAAIPQIGMRVIKRGGYREETTGIITGVLGYGIHLYDAVPRIIGRIVHIVPEEPEKTISAPGDSGAWWLDCATHRAVALHFAGSASPHFALALSLPEVLTALEAEIIAEDRPASRRDFVSNAGAPQTILPPGKTHYDYSPERQIGAFAKIVSAGLLVLLFIAATGYNLRLLLVHHQQKEQIRRLHRHMLQLQMTARLDSARRQSIQKITAIIEIMKPKMNSDLKLKIADEICRMSRKYSGLEVELVCATITHETGWNPEAVSSSGALGLMQILPSTGIHLAREEEITWSTAEKILFDPIWNIRLGCRYLARLVKAYELDAGLAAYNGGERQAQRWLSSGRASGILHAETAAYVPSVLRIYKRYRHMANGGMNNIRDGIW